MGGLPKSFIKKYGITKLAWRKWRESRKGGKKKRTTQKNPKRRGSKTSKKGGFSLGMGWKGLIIGTLCLAAAKYLARRFLGAYGAYADGAAMVGASFIPIGGTKAMRPVGIMELGSEFINDLISPNGVATLSGFGGSSKGYDV